MEKLNKGYKPLGMAVFLAIGGLLSGLLWSALFASNSTGMVQERRVSGGSTLLPQAEGAEIDRAALTPQSAPFLASADAGSGSVRLAENTNVLYDEGAIKDPEQAVKTKTTAASTAKTKALTSAVLYRVTARDTAASISAAFGIPIDTIVEFNPSVNFSALVAGVSIVIPSQQDVASLAG